MDAAQQREYVRRWVETGSLLEDIRWRELGALDDTVALEAANRLIEAALRVPLPLARVVSSGLVEQQALLHRRRAR